LIKPIYFTAHALDKLGIIRQQGFPVHEDTVVRTVLEPQEVFLGYSGRYIAQAVLDASHILRVVYEEESEAITVVTLYPGRRRQYGS
jgi:hypothetical protein